MYCQRPYISAASLSPVRLCLPGVVGVLLEAVPGLTSPRPCSAHQLSWVCCKRLYPGRTLAPALLRSSGVVDMLTESGQASAKDAHKEHCLHPLHRHLNTPQLRLFTPLHCYLNTPLL